MQTGGRYFIPANKVGKSRRSGMNILVVMGSPRKGNTYRAVKRIEEHFQSFEDAAFTYLMLGDINLSPCRGCNTCFVKGEEYCPIKDDVPAIEQQMHDARGVIFASPVYGMNVSGLFKTFVDRFAYIFHRPRFFGKNALLITTVGAGIGQKEVLTYMNLVARVWGFEVAHQTALITPPYLQIPKSLAQENERKLQEAADTFHRALQRKGPKSPAFSDVLNFRAGRGAYDELGEKSPTDYRYWKERGWLDTGTKYFVDVPVNPVFNLLGYGMEWYVRRHIRKLFMDAE
jgi:multimeric flavodoxin WrbA